MLVPRHDDADVLAFEGISDPCIIKGVYPSEAVEETGHIWGGQHDDDTHEFEFFMDDPDSTEEKDGVTRYIFSDGAVFIQHEGQMKTEREYLGEL